MQIANILIHAVVQDFTFGETSRRNFHLMRQSLIEWKVAISPEAKSRTIAVMSIHYLYTIALINIEYTAHQQVVNFISEAWNLDTWHMMSDNRDMHR